MKDMIYNKLGCSWRVAIVIYFLSSCHVRAQWMPYERGKCFNFQILNKELVLTPGPDQLSVDVAIKNSCDSSFILYDFKIINPGSSNLKLYTQPNYVAGNFLFVLDQKDEVKYLFRPWPPKPVGKFISPDDSSARVGNAIRQHAERMIENKLVLKSNSTWKGKLEALVDKREFAQGEYSFFLIYSCGRNITNVIDRGVIDKEEEISNAILFKGFLKSNTVKLILKR